MNHHEEAVEQVVASKKNTLVNSSIAQVDFNRLAASHFSSHVLPELKRFEDCLRHQGVRVNLLSAGQGCIRATLAIECPVNTYNLLVIFYDFAERALLFESVIGANDRETRERFSLAQLGGVSSAVVYGIFEEFVSTVFNSDSLCEYEDEGEGMTEG